MFDWIFRKAQNNDALTLDILHHGKDIAEMYPKLEIFYHYTLYEKLVEILICTYSGYNGDVFRFLPPPDYLDDLYERLRRAFIEIDKKPYLKELHIIDFIGFPDLYGNHHEQIAIFENSIKLFLEDKEVLRKNVPQMYPLSYEIKTIFADVDKLIIRHNEAKENLLHPQGKGVYSLDNLFIDLQKGQLSYKKIRKDVPLEVKEFKFLTKLLANRGVIIRNKDMARYLGWKPMEHEEDKDFSQKLKDTKQSLGEKLITLGITKTEVKQIKDRIVSNQNYGYKII